MRLLLSLFILVFLSGCAKVVDDFVAGGDPAAPPPVLPAPTDPDPSNQLKLSPGMVRSTSASLSMTAHITTTRHVMTSSNVSAVIGLHKNR